MKSAYPNSIGVASGSLGYANQAYPADAVCARQSDLEVIHSRIRGAVEHVEVLIENLANAEGRLLGGGSINGKEQSTRPQPCGHIGGMNSTLEDLGERISIAQQIANRLAEAI